jgi:hypothetical protein
MPAAEQYKHVVYNKLQKKKILFIPNTDNVCDIYMGGTYDMSVCN